MRRTHPLAIFLLLLLCVPLFGQSEEAATPNEIYFAYRYPYRLMQELLRAESEGKLTFYRFQGEEGRKFFTTFVGLSEEQEERINKRLAECGEEFPESDFEERAKKINELSFEEVSQLCDDAIDANLTVFDTVSKIFHEELTPEQIQMMRELELVLSSVLEDSDFSLSINFDAYETLELTEEQQAAFAKLRNELEAIQKDFFDLASSKIDDELAGERSEQKENAFSEKHEKLVKRAETFGGSIQEKIQEILTPSQRERLARIREELPKKIAAIVGKPGNENATGEQPDDESWKDSWKPGDPMPVKTRSPFPGRRFPAAIKPAP